MRAMPQTRSKKTPRLSVKPGRPWTWSVRAGRTDWPTSVAWRRDGLDSGMASSGASPATSQPFPAVHRRPGRPVLAVPVGLVGRIGATRGTTRAPSGFHCLRRRPRRAHRPGQPLWAAGLRPLRRPSSSPPTGSLSCRARFRPVAWPYDAEDGDPDESLTDDGAHRSGAGRRSARAPRRPGRCRSASTWPSSGSALPRLVHASGRLEPGAAVDWKAPFVIAVVSAFLLIDVMGLCNTYGILSWA